MAMDTSAALADWVKSLFEFTSAMTRSRCAPPLCTRGGRLPVLPTEAEPMPPDTTRACVRTLSMNSSISKRGSVAGLRRRNLRSPKAEPATDAFGDVPAGGHGLISVA